MSLRILTRIAVLLACVVLLHLLGGCASVPHGSVIGGECKVFERPPYVVRGSRQYDQDWIDSTVEGGVGACGWQRPAARPADLDAPKPMPVKAKPAPKPKAWLRFLRGLRHQPAVEVPAVEATEPPAPKPRRPIDALLGVK